MTEDPRAVAVHEMLDALSKLDSGEDATDAILVVLLTAAEASEDRRRWLSDFATMLLGKAEQLQ